MEQLSSILSFTVAGVLIGWAIQMLVSPYKADPILLALGITLPILAVASFIAGVLTIGK